MYMPYTTNPHLPRLRMEAAKLVLLKGWSTRQVSRHTGFNQSSIVRWVNKARMTTGNIIPTESSRPHHHPNELSPLVIKTIIAYREKHKRCAEVIHYLLKQDGYDVSLSSVKRTLRRYNMTKYSKWKKWHQYPERPIPEKPGILVQIDTIVDGPLEDRLYVYTMLDICSRYSFAMPVLHANTHASWKFVKESRQNAPFPIFTLQSDHGS